MATSSHPGDGPGGLGRFRSTPHSSAAPPGQREFAPQGQRSAGIRGSPTGDRPFVTEPVGGLADEGNGPVEAEAPNRFHSAYTDLTGHAQATAPSTVINHAHTVVCNGPAEIHGPAHFHNGGGGGRKDSGMAAAAGGSAGGGGYAGAGAAWQAPIPWMPYFTPAVPQRNAGKGAVIAGSAMGFAAGALAQFLVQYGVSGAIGKVIPLIVLMLLLGSFLQALTLFCGGMRNFGEVYVHCLLAPLAGAAVCLIVPLKAEYPARISAAMSLAILSAPILLAGGGIGWWAHGLASLASRKGDGDEE